MNNVRIINPSQVFEALVDWFYYLAKSSAPGFMIGLSGTDSIVTFCAAYKALERAGKPNRIIGVHFIPSEDFIYDHPEAEVHLWFQNQVLPWLKNFAPEADVIVDSSIDWRADGLRWGYLLDLSVVSNYKKRMIRLPEDQYWVVGTRNRSEKMLLNYSNISMSVSLQPIIHLWKSEILQLSEYLKVPKIALDKSCETDCICGRQVLAANHIKEIDKLLMVRCGELSESDVPEPLQTALNKFIDSQIARGQFKNKIPYIPNQLLFEFESGLIDVKKFNHFKHLDIAFQYLKSFDFNQSLERYGRFLKPILDSANQSHKFNMEITKSYFLRLDKVMKEYPNINDFESLAKEVPSVLEKIV